MATMGIRQSNTGHSQIEPKASLIIPILKMFSVFVQLINMLAIWLAFPLFFYLYLGVEWLAGYIVLTIVISIGIK